jgi:hypothetical protein
LELFNQVFVRSLSESLSFFRIEVNVVDQERSFSELETRRSRSSVAKQVRSLLEFEVDSDVVILYLYTLAFAIFKGSGLYFKHIICPKPYSL